METTFLIGGYTLYQLFWFFIFYSCFGWAMEVVYNSLRQGHYINTGFLNGPWSPIYGVGALLVILFLQPHSDSVFITFLYGVFITSALEFFTGVALKKWFHTVWWDYTGYFMNIGGYICFEYSLLWGVICLILTRVLHPLLRNFNAFIPDSVGVWFVLPVAGLLLADSMVSYNQAKALSRDLGILSDIGKGLRRTGDRMAENLYSNAVSLEERRNQFAARRARIHRRILKAFPTLRYTKDAEAAKTMQQWLRHPSGTEKAE